VARGHGRGHDPRARSSRIYYRGKFYDYPLNLFNALSNIGPYESVRILLSYIKWQLKRDVPEASFEDWVMKRFGGRLYMHFLQELHRKGLGHSSAQHPGRLGGTADQEPVPGQGGLERDFRRQ
jgi:protoporphyrinogen oxidase